MPLTHVTQLNLFIILMWVHISEKALHFFSDCRRDHRSPAHSSCTSTQMLLHILRKELSINLGFTHLPCTSAIHTRQTPDLMLQLKKSKQQSSRDRRLINQTVHRYY